MARQAARIPPLRYPSWRITRNWGLTADGLIEGAHATDGVRFRTQSRSCDAGRRGSAGRENLSDRLRTPACRVDGRRQKKRHPCLKSVTVERRIASGENSTPTASRASHHRDRETSQRWALSSQRSSLARK